MNNKFLRNKFVANRVHCISNINTRFRRSEHVFAFHRRVRSTLGGQTYYRPLTFSVYVEGGVGWGFLPVGEKKENYSMNWLSDMEKKQHHGGIHLCQLLSSSATPKTRERDKAAVCVSTSLDSFWHRGRDVSHFILVVLRLLGQRNSRLIETLPPFRVALRPMFVFFFVKWQEQEVLNWLQHQS
jgi:hypothetical protein